MGRGFQCVAGRPHGANQIFAARDIECLAQAADVDVHGARFDKGIIAPDLVEQLFARIDPAGVLDEMAQKTKFNLAQLHRLPCAGHTMGRKVHDDIGEAQLVRFQCRSRPAQHCMDAGDQLAR